MYYRIERLEMPVSSTLVTARMDPVKKMKGNSVLKRNGYTPSSFINAIYDQIIEKDGEQVGEEGCLSVPGKAAIVKRPNHVKVRAYDLKMKEFELEGEELLARAICHECDHLDGILYVDNTEGEVFDVTAQDDEQESEPLQDEL